MKQAPTIRVPIQKYLIIDTFNSYLGIEVFVVKNSLCTFRMWQTSRMECMFQ